MNKLRLEAAKNGHKHYDGKPCVNCGDVKRYVVSDACVACMKANTYKHRQKIKRMIADYASAAKAE